MFFGNAYIAGTELENQSVLAWSYNVLMHAFKRALTEQETFLQGFGNTERTAISDVLHVMEQSKLVFKHMLMLMKFASETQLLTFLRRVKKLLSGLDVGEMLLLPIMVEGDEMIFLVERTTPQLYTLVLISTDVDGGLRWHPVTPEFAPKLKYRSAIVFPSIPKKSALDDVFWMAVYNALINGNFTHHHFYEVLLPFCTGKPLESSLVEMEAEKDSKMKGDWRSPQKSRTAYVRSITHAIFFMLRHKGLDVLQAKQVLLALRVQMARMLKHDLGFVQPDNNGQHVCSIVVSALSSATTKLIGTIDKAGQSSGLTRAQTAAMLEEVVELADEIRLLVDASREERADLPPILDLSGEDSKAEDWMQFQGSMAWEAEQMDPNPGTAQLLGKYTPVDLLQLPTTVRTRDEAVLAVRLADRLCTLLENQDHCIKNDKMLILSTIEHVFIQLVPVPKPRAVKLNEADKHRAERTERRNARRERESKAKRERAQAKRAEKSSASGGKKEATSTSKADTTSGPVERPPRTRAPLTPDEEEPCLWDAPITYELQMELVTTLRRLTQHFIAAAMSQQQSRSLDAVCVTVCGCMAAIADAVLRRRAYDLPSEVCSHLMGQTRDGKQLGYYGFGISVGTFATQARAHTRAWV